MNNVEILGENINRLNVSNRTHNCLCGWPKAAFGEIGYWRQGGKQYITTIGDLVSHNSWELLQLKNFGPTTLIEVETALDKLGLKLSERYL